MKNLKTEILEILKNASLDIDYIYTLKQFDEINEDNIEELKEALEELVNEIEVIYYGSAMDYLKENDPSLQICFWIAHELGIENINSEMLATILKQDIQMELLQEAFIEIENILN